MTRQKRARITTSAPLSAALLLLALVFAIALAGCDLFPDEPPPPPPDWTPQDAEFITLTEGVWADGNIPSSGGKQWFKFTATAEMQYIHVSFGTLTDLSAQLYDNKGKTVSDSGRLSSNTSYISRTVTSGKTYYIEVRPYYAYSGKGDYKIAFNTSSTSPIWTPPTADITTLTENVWADGNIPTSTGEQWFKFIATTSYSHYIHVTFGTLTNMDAQFYNGDGTEVGSDVFGTYRSTYLSVTNGKTYFIKVSPRESGSGTYQIAFNTSSTRPPGTWIPSASFTTLTESVWADGNIPTPSGEQWFKFTATSYSHYIHITLGTLTNLAVQLYDSFGSTVGTSSNFTTNSYVLQSSLTSGQIYYIKVQPNSGSGNYQIAFHTSSINSSIIVWPPTNVTTLTANTWTQGNIATANGEQWFIFTATASSQYIYFSTSGTLKYVDVQPYNNSGAKVGSETYFYSNNSTGRTLTSGQPYYIRVSPSTGTSTGTYYIAFGTSRPAGP